MIGELFPFFYFGGLLFVWALGPIVIGTIVVWRIFRRHRRLALAAGYPTLRAYLAAAPRTDEERRQAADLALKGLVICLLGLLMPPILLIGLVPFFYGARKLVYAWMGLGLVDDVG